MAQRDLLELWLQQAIKDRQRRATDCYKQHNKLKDKSTDFANAVLNIARAHSQAAAVYIDFLARFYPEHDMSS